MKIEERAAFKQRVLQDLKKRSSFGFLPYVAITWVIIISDDFYKRQPSFSFLFGFSITAICLFRLALVLLPENLWNKHNSLCNTLFFISTGSTSLAWGTYFAYSMVLEQEYTFKLLMAICTATFAAGGNMAFLPNLRLSVFYVFGMLAPAIVFMSILQINLPLAVIILFYLIYMILMANRANREYWQALETEQLLIKKTEQLKLLSRIDGLTGLYNRRHFDECLDREWKKTCREQQPPSVIICDIDFFKRINDLHGHQAGDEFLKRTVLMVVIN